MNIEEFVEGFVRQFEDPKFLLLFSVLSWCAVMLLISRIGGWSRLAEYYPNNNLEPTQTWGFESVSLRYYTGYNGCINMGCDSAALYLSVWLPFRIGHPNLRIPWSDLHKSAAPIRFGVVRLIVSKAPDIPLRLRQSQVERRESTLGQAIPTDQEGASLSWT